MNKIYIAIRIPGFYAGLEKNMLPELVNIPVVVALGEDQRSVVLSACELARENGVKPGMRIGDIQDKRTIVLESTPEKYQSEINRVEDLILEEIPRVHYMRPGLFMAIWDGTGRFIEKPVKRLLKNLRERELTFFVGMAHEAGLAELAAMRADESTIIRVDKSTISSFLTETPIDLLYDIPRDKVLLLKEMGINSCAELAMLPDHALVTLFGKEGKQLKVLLLTGKRVSGRQEWRRAIRITEKISTEKEFRNKVYSLLHTDEIQENLYEFIKTVFHLTLIYTDGRRISGSFRLDKDIHHEGKLSEILWKNVKNLWKRRVQIAEIRLRVIPGQQYAGQLDIFGREKASIRNQALMNSITELRQKWGSLSVQFANNPVVRCESASSC